MVCSTNSVTLVKNVLTFYQLALLIHAPVHITPLFNNSVLTVTSHFFWHGTCY